MPSLTASDRKRALSIGLVLAGLLSGLFPGVAPALEYEVWSPPLIGEELPDFTLLDTAGKEVHLRDFRGKVILLSFWACYSDTCFTSVPALDELAKKFGPDGLVVPTVCTEIPPGLAADGYSGLVKLCSKGQTILIDEQKLMKKRFHILHNPTAYLVGRDFRIREIVVTVARLRNREFAADVEALVKGTFPAAPASTAP